MDRTTWLKEMQRDCEAQYDTRWSPLYGEKWGLYNNTTHLQYIQELLSLLPKGNTILDAACGAGRYEPFLLEGGFSVVGIDQSQGMLDKARLKFPGVQYEKIGLQQMSYRDAFDGIICIDAMENVCPEDWSPVLRNFHQALKPQGYLYFTAETIENTDEGEIKEAYEKAQQAGHPVVYGESLEEEVYHFHPTNQQVREWAVQAGFEIIKEGNGEIWYYHILLRKILER